MATRILLIHNHFLVTAGLKTLISSYPEFELAGELQSVDQVSWCRAKNIDVVIFNFKDLETGVVNMPKYQSMFPGAKFLSISFMPSRFEVSEGLNKGVLSFLLTDCDGDEIAESIRSTAIGEQFFCGKILSQVMQSQDEALPASEYVCEGIKISPRESEIIRLVADGLTNKEIADRLFLSAHTVTTHRKNIMAKLGVNNTAGLVLFAIRNNIVTPNHFLFSGN
jgi:DNA-binding NarL/FixJ family response regulator